jgi:hypothetical protein
MFAGHDLAQNDPRQPEIRPGGDPLPTVVFHHALRLTNSARGPWHPGQITTTLREYRRVHGFLRNTTFTVPISLEAVLQHLGDQKERHVR